MIKVNEKEVIIEGDLATIMADITSLLGSYRHTLSKIDAVSELVDNQKIKQFCVALHKACECAVEIIGVVENAKDKTNA